MVTRIVADSVVDKRSLDGAEFASVPLSVSTDERSFSDDENLDLYEMLEYLGSYKGRSYTSCPGIDKWLQVYEGADILYVVTLSGNVSATYSTAVAAAEMYCESNKNARVKVFNSLSAGPECRLIIDKIAELVREGKEFDEVCALTEEYMAHTRVFFALESFHNFAENGRVNKVVAAAAGVLGIRIMATASTEGTIDVVAKCRGEKGTLKTFIECMKNAGYNGKKVYIGHCNNMQFADKIAAEIKNMAPDAEIEIYTTGGLASYYAEKGGILLACECDKKYE